MVFSGNFFIQTFGRQWPLNNYFVEKPVTKAVFCPDEKIMIVEDGKKLIKLNGNLVDPSFNTGSGFNYSISDFVFQPDGKVIVVGGFTTYDSSISKKIVRLNIDGSKDLTFNNAGVGFNQNFDFDEYETSTVRLQPDGKIIVYADGFTYNGITFNKIIRLNPNGSVDTSFVTDTSLHLSSSSHIVYLKSDGKILTVRINSISSYQIVRLNTNGSIDNSFNISIFNDNVFGFGFQPDGKIIASGAFTTVNGIISNRLVRLNLDGSVDSSFNIGSGLPISLSGNKNKIEIQPDGKVIVYGLFSNYNGISCSNLVRLNTDGSKDVTFSTGLGFDDNVSQCQILLDGKIFVFGSFIRYNNQTVNFITRLNTDGTRDTSFNNICKGFIGDVEVVAFQPDGKILVAGDKINAYNGVSNSGMMRLNTDGSFDDSLTYGGLTGFNDYIGGYGYNVIKNIVIQPDSKILVGGNFTGFNNVVRNRIIRLNVDGTRDTSFSIGTGFNYEVKKIILLSNGKIIVAGNFTSYQGSSCPGIIKLNANGSRDLTFNSSWIGTGGGQPYVDDIILQQDGKILTIGNFNIYLITTEENILRLNIDGTRDTTFITASNTFVNGYIGL